jgi:hypothetical protein
MAVTTRKTPIKYRRGKPVPTLRHGDLIDWTTFPLNSKPNGRRIERCPECGRKGEASHYRSGGSSYTHLSRFETMFWMVKDSCNVGKIG